MHTIDTVLLSCFALWYLYEVVAGVRYHRRLNRANTIRRAKVQARHSIYRALGYRGCGVLESEKTDE